MKNNNLAIKLLIKEVKLIPKLYKSFDYSNVHQKYSLTEYLTDILYVNKTGIAWRDLRSHINWNSVYRTYRRLLSFGVFKTAYIDLLKKHYKRSGKGKKAFLLSDTTFIPNKKGHDFIGYNTYYNRKRGTKISFISLKDGIPINVKCCKGNKYDSKILADQLDTKNLIDISNDKRQIYFLADPAYDSSAIRSKLKKLNYKPIIAKNKRNTKDPSKIVKLSKSEIKMYRKRLAIERTFNKIKFNKRLCQRYDSKIETFVGFIYLALIKLLC